MEWQVVATGVNPWLRDPILKSPEGATCVSTLGETLENLMPPLSGLLGEHPCKMIFPPKKQQQENRSVEFLSQRREAVKIV